MAATGEGIMVLLQDVIEGADSKDLRALLEEAIKAPGPHHLVSDSAQADPRVHVVLTTNDGATFLPKRDLITEHSGLIRDLLADVDSNGVAKDPVPLQNVGACELKRMLWFLQQDFDATQLERCIGAFDIEGVVALQEAANFMDVRCITVACGGAIARRVREAVDDEERSRLVELVTPPRLPRELCELWLGCLADDVEELLKLLVKYPDQLLMLLADLDCVWTDKGRFSEHSFNLSDETELALLKARMEVIEQSRRVSSLKVRLYKETGDDDLRSVGELLVLSSLDLTGCKEITDVGLVHLKELSVLTSLDLCGCDQITDAGLAHVKELIQLKSLNLSGYNKITNTGLAHVKELTQLTALKLGPCNWITDTGVAHLKVLVQLTSLSLCDCEQVTDMCLTHIKELTQLTSLNFERCSQITDMGLVHVKVLLQLKSLRLFGCEEVMDAGLVHIKVLTQLTSLDLSCCTQITDAGLMHVKELAQLTSLSLYGCYQVTDDSLAQVKVLAQLKELNLRGCFQITDTGLVHVKELTELTALSLCECEQVTDGGLVHIKELKQLTELKLGYCKSITREGGLFASILAGYVDADELARADVTWKLPDGTTLLHAAAGRDKKEVIKALIKRGADVNAVDGTGRTPLQLAIEANATDAMRLLQ